MVESDLRNIYNKDDAELVRAFQNGDERAFDALVVRYQNGGVDIQDVALSDQYEYPQE